MINLAEMLQAREERVELRERLRVRYHTTVVCLTMNIAGPEKRFNWADRAFFEAEELMRKAVVQAGFTQVYQQLRQAETGLELFLCIDADPQVVKDCMIAVETATPLGRLFDIDVFGHKGEKLSRPQLRTCLICNQPAAACARSRTHTVEALRQKTETIIKHYFLDVFAKRLAGNAVRAMLYEVSVTPKPGLVDRHNNGAHHDMNYFTFLDSAAVLFPYFEAFVRHGAVWQGGISQLVQSVRASGKQAEEAMFRATKGINTHKGLLFSLGLLAVCAGYLWQQKTEFSLTEWLNCCAQAAKPLLGELADKTGHTNGAILYQEQGVLGIRGEAASGFETVKKIGLPILQTLLQQGVSYDEAGAVTLMHLIAYGKQDTCLLHRAGVMEVEIREQAKRMIEQMPDPTSLLNKIADWDVMLSTNGFSPGGSADLLAICFFLSFQEEVN